MFIGSKTKVQPVNYNCTNYGDESQSRVKKRIGERMQRSEQTIGQWVNHYSVSYRTEPHTHLKYQKQSIMLINGTNMLINGRIILINGNTNHLVVTQITLLPGTHVTAITPIFDNTNPSLTT